MFSLEKVSNRPLGDYIILYSIPFAYFRGFEYIGFDITMLKMFLFVSVFCLFFYVAKTLFHVTDDVSQYSKNILYVFLISSAMALVFHDQGLVMSYRSGISFAFIIFYFYLIRRKFTIREIQYMVAFYGTLWVLLWLIAQYNAPVRLFGDPDAAINEQRGISRFLIPGDCFLYMFYFCKPFYLHLLVILFDINKINYIIPPIFYQSSFLHFGCYPRYRRSCFRIRLVSQPNVPSSPQLWC